MKNNYIVTKSEVRTTYSIQIPVTSIKDILAAAKDSALKEIYWKIDTINLENYLDKPYREVEKNFINMWRYTHTEAETTTIKFIVELLGFDGVDNYGYFDEKNKLIKMSVYKYGDQIN